MTKQQEVELLDETIRRFGNASYIGAWLNEIRPEIVAAVERDFPVNALMPSAALDHGVDMMNLAQAECTRLIQKAAADADEIIERAKAELLQHKQWAIRQIDEARARLERV